MCYSPCRGHKGVTPLDSESAPNLRKRNVTRKAPAKADAPQDIDARIAAVGDLILSRLDDDKAQDVVFIDLKGKSPIADGLIVASGRSQRHVGAMADHLLRALKEAGYGRCRVEGMPSADWVLIDAGDVIVHLFRPEVRSFYNIEKIWSVDSAHRGLAV